MLHSCQKAVEYLVFNALRRGLKKACEIRFISIEAVAEKMAVNKYPGKVSGIKQEHGWKRRH